MKCYRLSNTCNRGQYLIVFYLAGLLLSPQERMIQTLPFRLVCSSEELHQYWTWWEAHVKHFFSALRQINENFDYSFSIFHHFWSFGLYICPRRRQNIYIKKERLCWQVWYPVRLGISDSLNGFLLSSRVLMFWYC